jgi:glutathione S-transferase
VGDIILYCALDFGAGVGQKIDPSLKNVNAWFKRVEARPSAKASLHPASAQTGMKG